MSRSPIVFAAAYGAGSAPDRGGYRLCQQVDDRFGLDDGAGVR